MAHTANCPTLPCCILCSNKHVHIGEGDWISIWKILGHCHMWLCDQKTHLAEIIIIDLIGCLPTSASCIYVCLIFHKFFFWLHWLRWYHAVLIVKLGRNMTHTAKSIQLCPAAFFAATSMSTSGRGIEILGHYTICYSVIREHTWNNHNWLTWLLASLMHLCVSYFSLVALS